MSEAKRYIVYVKEIHQSQFEVEALNEEDALDKALNGEGIWLDNTMEFLETLDPESWDCEEVL